jgi:AsmA family
MLKKVAIGVAVLVLLLSAVGFFWARSILATDTVRMALAAQISAAIGQPVTIRSIGAGIYPRVTVNLRGVTIGQPARIQAETLRLGTDFRALLSRQIVHGAVRLDGARVELPLPPFGSSGTSSGGSGSSGWPVEIVSIDSVLLNNVEVVSGGRTLRGDIEAVPRGTGLTLRKVSLEADDTDFDATGEITDLAGPVGAIDIKAGTLNLARLLTFFAEFSSGFGTPGRAGSRQASGPRTAGNTPAMNLTLSLNANRATMGALALERLMGKARVTREGVLLDPVDFGLFNGQYKGSLALSLADSPALRLRAALSNIDVAAAMAFAGSPGTLTGLLSGRLDLTSGGTEASKVIDGARGTARVDIKDGVVKNHIERRTFLSARRHARDRKWFGSNQRSAVRVARGEHARHRIDAIGRQRDRSERQRPTLGGVVAAGRARSVQVHPGTGPRDSACNGDWYGSVTSRAHRCCGSGEPSDEEQDQ